ncbi:unnamed protein product [Acanthoscelides obtectus]|uniref:Uncharacterized protein n=1 Tax=Acanthoscelides obtectus TaxID=200917 RepID=A0A9P0P4A5_ACAOB|nr:unnamed protein product [Acanthoscelides obtectus]CAK1645361.1 hypothetical protein AOBTE_LOCUS14096 [Acanthoscelides obtectus]
MASADVLLHPDTDVNTTATLLSTRRRPPKPSDSTLSPASGAPLWGVVGSTSYKYPCPIAWTTLKLHTIRCWSCDPPSLNRSKSAVKIC